MSMSGPDLNTILDCFGRGNVNELKFLLDQIPSESPLRPVIMSRCWSRAIIDGLDDIVGVLLEKDGQNISAADFTAHIMCALGGGHFAVAELLCRHDKIKQLSLDNHLLFIAESASIDGLALFKACAQGDLALLNEILEKDIPYPHIHSLALYFAAISGRQTIVQRLLQDNRLPLTLWGATALHAAHKNEHNSVVELLLHDKRFLKEVNKEGLIDITIGLDNIQLLKKVIAARPDVKVFLDENYPSREALGSVVTHPYGFEGIFYKVSKAGFPDSYIFGTYHCLPVPPGDMFERNEFRDAEILAVEFTERDQVGYDTGHGARVVMDIGFERLARSMGKLVISLENEKVREKVYLSCLIQKRNQQIFHYLTSKDIEMEVFRKEQTEYLENKREEELLQDYLRHKIIRGDICPDELDLAGRNKSWMTRLLPLLKKRCFVAVGAAHLGGQNGLLKLLENEGFEVTVQHLSKHPEINKLTKELLVQLRQPRALRKEDIPSISIDPEGALFAACESGELQDVEIILRDYSDTLTNLCKQRALQLAARLGHDAIIVHMLKDPTIREGALLFATRFCLSHPDVFVSMVKFFTQEDFERYKSVKNKEDSPFYWLLEYSKIDSNHPWNQGLMNILSRFPDCDAGILNHEINKRKLDIKMKEADQPKAITPAFDLQENVLVRAQELCVSSEKQPSRNTIISN